MIIDPLLSMAQSQSLNLPPYFDENNYACWNVRMITILKSLDEHVWTITEKGRWKQTDTPVEQWFKDEINEYN